MAERSRKPSFMDDGRGLVKVTATCDAHVDGIYEGMQAWRDMYPDRFARCVSVSVVATGDLGGIRYDAIIVYRPS